jgi:hypothetical protein
VNSWLHHHSVVAAVVAHGLAVTGVKEDWLQRTCCRKQVSSIGCSSKRAENQLHQLAAAQNVQKTNFINWLQLKTCRKPASSMACSWII